MANDTLQGWGRSTWSSGAWSQEGTVPVTGVQASSSAGAADAVGTSSVPTTGLQATGSIGQVDSFQSAKVIPTGVEASGSIGNAFASLPIDVPVTGVQAETATEFGWGRGVWSQGEWGQPTGGAGQVQVGVGDLVRATGVEATGSVGSLTATGTSNVPATGIEITASVGTVRVEADVAFDVTGNSATAGLGAYNVFTDHEITVFGVQGTTAVGQAISFQSALVKPTGIQASADLGTPFIFSTVDVPVTGLEATSGIGSVSVVANADVAPSGVSARALPPSPITFSGFGDAQISTAQSKFGGASLLLDGSGDYLESQEAYNFAGDPFTVDMWVRPANATQDAVFFDGRDSTSNNAIALRQAADNLLVLRGNGTLFNINSVFSADTWVHIAVTRGDPFGNTYRVFVNGVEADSTLFGITASAANIHIGSDFNGSNNWAGYIDELRVSNVDRYGGNDFTPPASAYTADDNTPVLLHFDGANGSTTFTNDGLIEAVIVTGTANVPATGLEASGSIGSVLVTGTSNVSVTGVQGTARTAQVTISASALVALTGVSSTGIIGKVTVWGKIVPNPGTVWTKIAA